MPTNYVTWRFIGGLNPTPVIPQGGTWACFISNDNGGTYGGYAGVYSGGASLGYKEGYWPGFCWKLA